MTSLDPGAAEQPDLGLAHALPDEAPAGEDAAGAAAEEDARGRRRGRRGGRRRRREPEGEAKTEEAGGEAPSSFDAAPAYVGPTPADPFGQVYDIFDIMDAPEAEAAPQPAPASPEPPPISVPDNRPLEEAEAAEATLPAAAEPAELHAAMTQESVEEPPPLSNGHDAAAPLPADDTAAEPVSSPVAPPMLVSGEAPATEKKRGWWRR